MTQRLYYTDAYLTRFSAAVTERGDGGSRIYLDRTAFYPTSGGQPHDTGRLGGVAVVEVLDEGDRIAHLLDSPLAADQVEGEIDWAHRFDHMQQHTGQHLLSAVLADLAGHATISVHFGRDGSTLDLNTGSLSHDLVIEAERRANRVVTENRPVEVSFENSDTAEGLRKASAREGTLRVVTIRDLDRSACGGTHVRATGEIGPILIRRQERVRKAVRLEFLCGERAVRAARADHDLLAALAAACSAAPEELISLIEAQRAELKAAVVARRELETDLAGYRARELYDAAASGDGSPRVVTVREESGPVDRLRPLAHAVAALPRAVFIGAAEAPAAVLLASSEDSGVDAGRLLRETIEQAGGRGGGNPRLAQGSIPDPAGLPSLLDQLAAAIAKQGRY